MATLRHSIIASVLFVVFGGPGIVLVWLPLWVTRFRIPAPEPWWQILLAVSLILAGLSPAFESMRRFIVVGRGSLVPTVPTQQLVVSGFYRHVRNPMYLGVAMAVAGEALLLRSRFLIIFAAILWLGFHLFVCFYEEPALTRRYGDEYLRFKRNAPRWLPQPKPWRVQ